MALKLLETFWSAQDGRSRTRKCGLLLLSGVILAFLLPYDSSGDLNFVLGAGEWLAHALILMMATGPIGRMLFPRLTSADTPAVIAIILFAALNAIPVLLMSVLFDYLLVSYEAPFSYGADVYLWWLVESLLLTLLVIGSLSVVAIKFELTTNQTEQQHTKPGAGQQFFNRLSPELGTTLMCFEMEDHYLRVHTAKGNELHHMKMADAINELDDYPGIQVHRSWWIALSAVETISKHSRDYKAHLKNGMIVPISRSRVEALREKGLL